MSSVTEFTESGILSELSKMCEPIELVGVKLLPEYPKQQGFTIEQFQQHCTKAITFCAESFTKNSAAYFVLKDPFKVYDSNDLNSLRNRFENELGVLHEKVEYDYRFIVQNCS
ncbi:hypothetical protein [Sporosarcina sp. FA9]|uniref:hypothetical protein n=1 Tax=Sporosarcina sp. FA9 TaxID=3413030 RepID=UPI003F65A849